MFEGPISNNKEKIDFSFAKTALKIEQGMSSNKLSGGPFTINYPGMYKVHYSPFFGGGEVMKSLGEEYQVGKREGNIMAVGPWGG